MKKGFTLIELLAVIVILAIIAVIAVPIVLNIIDETKDNASLRSADFYLDAVEFSIAQSTLNNTSIKDGTYSIMNDGNICLGTLTAGKCIGKDNRENHEDDILKVEVNGEKPSGGSITIKNGNISDLSIVLNEKTIVKNEKNELEIQEVPKTLVDAILKAYGGRSSITSINNEWKITESSISEEFDFQSIKATDNYYWATDYEFDSNTSNHSSNSSTNSTKYNR